MKDDKYIELKFGDEDVVLLIARSSDPKSTLGDAIKRATREIPAWLNCPTWDEAKAKVETMPAGRYVVPSLTT